MVSLARAVVDRPCLLLLDEPSLRLAPDIIDENLRPFWKVAESGFDHATCRAEDRRARDFADGLGLIRVGPSIAKAPASDRRRIADLVRLTFDQA
jgi:branched-chain amino acid transport system ATP-binding protein